ncbi:uncharacterized protein WCC33_002891 [Rhinophrynus dorsalis]
MLTSHVVVYLDDILFFSPTLQQHRLHVKAVFQWLRENGLYAKLEKCEFEMNRLPFLGYMISNSSLEMNPKKLTAVLDCPQPTDFKAVQLFLGFANYYRRFIRGYSTLVAPITALTKKEPNPWLWPEEAVYAFSALKTAFTTAPVLRYPDITWPFVLEVDASERAIGAVLSQRDPKKNCLSRCP